MVQMTYLGVIRSMAVTGLCSFLLACGFHLQGQPPASADMTTISVPLPVASLPVVIDAQAAKSAYVLRLSLLKQLTRYDADAHIGDSDNQSEQAVLASLGIANRISIDDVSIQKYQLAGLLTEVRLTMTAKVSYHIRTADNAEPTTLNRTLMVERSYQYNQASVSVEDLQRTQTEADLYDAMARRIADQYVALSTK